MKFKLAISLLLSIYISKTANSQDSLGINIDSLLIRVQANQTFYKTLSERAILNWDDGKTNYQFNGNFRVNKDTVVWASLSMFGFEGARALVTPDTFRLLNKISAEYVVRDINYMQSWLLLPVNFTMLQQLIAGEQFSINEKAGYVTREDSSYVLYSETEKLLQKVWVNTENYTIKKLLLKDKLLKQDMAITFDAYKYSEAKPFASKRSITITRDTGVIKLDMEITRIKFDEQLSYPFEINEKYKRTE